MGSQQTALGPAGHNMWHRLAFSLSAVVLVRSLTVQQGVVDEENQAVVLEGPSRREGRQFKGVNDVVSPLLAPPLGTPCESNNGTRGLCMSLKSCYPYFKIHDFTARDTWVMGLYDTCSYQSPQGREVSHGFISICIFNLERLSTSKLNDIKNKKQSDPA